MELQINPNAAQILEIEIDESLMERTQHGQFAFPFTAYYDILKEKTLGFVNWHWHKEFQFCLVTGGAITCHINSSEYTISAGDGIFINSGCLHMVRSADGYEGTYICFNFHPKLLKLFPGSVFETRYLLPYTDSMTPESVLFSRSVSWQRDCLELFIRIYNLLEHESQGYELEIISLLYQFWCLLIRNIDFPDNKKRKNGHQNQIVSAILSYIAQNYSEALSIKDISKAAACSGSECCRIFKRTLNQTIFEYLNTYRLEQAAELLANSTLSVSDIAYETGCCSTSYVIKNFKKFFHTTPLQYRKR